MIGWGMLSKVIWKEFRYISVSNRAQVPTTWLTHLTLKRMELAISFPVSLPSLKAICLLNMPHYYDYSVQKLISWCPILKDLRLGAFNFSLSAKQKMHVKNACSPPLPALKHLWIFICLSWVIVTNSKWLRERRST